MSKGLIFDMPCFHPELLMANSPVLNNYLEQIAKQLVLPDPEKEKIDNSIKIIREKLIVTFFDDGLEDVRPFGSFDRQTLLSRKIDAESDVDMLVMFDEKKWQAQTYLSKLKKFAEDNYQRSEIFQDHPTIVISMNHIKFEMVPCIYRRETSTHYEKFTVPIKDGDKIDWTSTNPYEIKKAIHKYDKTRATLLKLISLFKYWNLVNGKLYKTTDAENFVLRYFDYEEDLFYNFMRVINNLNYSNPQKAQNDLNKKSKNHAGTIRYLLERNLENYALLELQMIIPPIQ